MPRHPPNAQKSTNSTQHTTTNLTSDTGARTALGPAQPTLRRAAHTRPPPTPAPPDQRTNGEDKRGPQGGGEPKQQQKNILDARVHYAVHNHPARNPPPPRHTPPRPPPPEPNRGDENTTEEETGPKGGPEPRAHRPRTRQRATPPQPPAPARRGNGPELKDENKRLRGRVEGAVAGRQGEPPLPARVRPATLRCSRPNRFETP